MKYYFIRSAWGTLVALNISLKYIFLFFFSLLCDWNGCWIEINWLNSRRMEVYLTKLIERYEISLFEKPRRSIALFGSSHSRKFSSMIIGKSAHCPVMITLMSNIPLNDKWNNFFFCNSMSSRGKRIEIKLTESVSADDNHRFFSIAFTKKEWYHFCISSLFFFSGSSFIMSNWIAYFTVWNKMVFLFFIN